MGCYTVYKYQISLNFSVIPCYSSIFYWNVNYTPWSAEKQRKWHEFLLQQSKPRSSHTAQVCVWVCVWDSRSSQYWLRQQSKVLQSGFCSVELCLPPHVTKYAHTCTRVFKYKYVQRTHTHTPAVGNNPVVPNHFVWRTPYSPFRWTQRPLNQYHPPCPKCVDLILNWMLWTPLTLCKWIWLEYIFHTFKLLLFRLVGQVCFHSTWSEKNWTIQQFIQQSK